MKTWQGGPPGLRRLRGLGWVAALLACGTPGLACATCGCSLSSDGATGFWATAGWRLSLQVDYLDQDQLRSGTGAVTAAAVAALNTPAPVAGQEVERRTVNRYTTLALSYAPDAEWNLKLLVPRIDRSHSTYGPASNPLTPDQLSGATVTGLGDVKVLASYQGFLPGHDLGLQFGLKLPTGAYGGQNGMGGPVVGRQPAFFGPAGNLGGMPLDTSLNAGTGSTDLLLGGYFFRPVSENLRLYVTGQFQAAVAERLHQPGSDFRPGNQGTLTFGLRYEADPACVPQLQVNLNRKDADQGGLADTLDTAGTVAYLSPGVEMAVGRGLRAYAFLQVPFASKLEGYQLFPHWTGSVGLTYHF